MQNKSLFLFILLSFLAATLHFFQLNNPRLTFSDELIIAEIADNMAQTENYLEPVLGGKVWLEKPPLYAWLTAPLIGLFGNHPWVWRFWSASATVGTTLVIYLITLTFFSPLASFTAGLIFTTNFFTLAISQAASLDLITVFFSTLAFFFFLKAEKENKRSLYFLTGFLIGLAVLGRSFFGLVLIPVIFFTFLSSLRQKKAAHYFFLFAALLITILPWHLFIAFRHPQAFLEKYLLLNSLDRFKTDFIYKDEPLVPSSQESLSFVLITNLGLLAALFSFPFLRNRSAAQKKLLFLLFVWIGIYGEVLVLSNASAPWHYLHLYPPLCILLGLCFEKILSAKKIFSKMWASILLAVTLGLGPFVCFVIKPQPDRIHTQEQVAALYPGTILYSWQKQFLFDSRFFHPQEIGMVDKDLIINLLEENEKILVFIPRHLEKEIPANVKIACVLEEKPYRVCWLSF